MMAALLSELLPAFGYGALVIVPYFLGRYAAQPNTESTRTGSGSRVWRTLALAWVPAIFVAGTADRRPDVAAARIFIFVCVATISALYAPIVPRDYVAEMRWENEQAPDHM